MLQKTKSIALYSLSILLILSIIAVTEMVADQYAFAAGTEYATTSTDVDNTGPERVTCYVNGYFWHLYTPDENLNLYLKSSQDGSSFGSATKVNSATIPTNYQIGLYCDETNDKLHIAYFSGDISDLIYRRGSAASDGTVTFDAAEQVVAASSSNTFFGVSINQDSNGNIFVLATDDNADTINLYKNANSDGTWSTASGYPKQITGVTIWTKMQLLPLNNGEMYIIWGNHAASNNNLLGAKFDGSSIGSTETWTSGGNRYGEFGAVAHNGLVYVVYTNTTFWIQSKSRAADGTISSAVFTGMQPSAPDLDRTNLALSKDNSGNLYAWTIQSDDIKQVNSTNGGSTWNTVHTPFGDTFTTPKWLSAGYNNDGNKIPVSWTESSAPYSLRVGFHTVQSTITQPIQLTAASGSDTFETQSKSATITCTGGGGTHDGNAALQNFSCNSGVTVTVALPAATASDRWMWSDGTTTDKTFAASTTQQNFTYYHQYKITLTFSGLDASRTEIATRTQAGSSNNQAITGSTATAVWADQGSNVIADNEVVVTASQERFYSYNSTSQRTITASSAQSKTIVFQHEFFQLFRVYEEHEGVIFAPMPDSVFTMTVTTANGTALSDTTFTSDDSQDDRSVLASRYWVKNGTQTAGAIQWRGLDVRPAGDTCSITSYGTCDFEVYSKHYGISGSTLHHFRIGADGLTADIDNVSFDDDTNILTFNATSSGTRTVKVEFLASNFEAVTSVEFNDTPISGADFTITNIDSTTRVLSITGQSFSENKIEVAFSSTSTGAGSGSSGGGGGGGGGGSTSPPAGSVTIPTGSSGTALTMTATIGEIHVAPGEHADFNVNIMATGASKIIVSSIVFGQNPDWFVIGKPLPFAATIAGTGNAIQTSVPVRVTVPPTEQGIGREIPVIVRASVDGTIAEAPVSAKLVYAASDTLSYLALGGVAAVAAVAVIAKSRNR